MGPRLCHGHETDALVADGGPPLLSDTGPAAGQVRYTVETVDARAVLPFVDSATLVLHNRQHVFEPLAVRRRAGRSERAIPQARLVELPDAGAAIDAASAEVLGDGGGPVPDRTAPSVQPSRRVLGSIQFSDVVGSTSSLALLGDDEWRRVVLDRHDRMCETISRRFGGREVKTTGDGLLSVRWTGQSQALCRGDGCGVVGSRGADPVFLAIRTPRRAACDAAICPGSQYTWLRVSRDFAEASEVIVTAPTPAELTRGSERAFAPRGHMELRSVGGTWASSSLAATDRNGEARSGSMR